MPTRSLIPPARRDAVREAFRAAFGTQIPRNLKPISGGVSGALIYRCFVRGRPHVLRLEPERLAFHDRARHYTCMATAAGVGAAPQVYFADPGSGVALMDYVSARPLSTHPGGQMGMARALGELVARVQSTPPFPDLGEYPESLAGMLDRLIEAAILPLTDTEPLARGLCRIREALPWNASLRVSAHNDPNPRNILFDGRRVWLVDWELAFLNDPLVDVAILATEMFQSRELQDVLLHAAFGVRPGVALHARLSIIRLLTRLFYGLVVLDSLGESARAAAASNLPTFTPEAFQRAVIDGRLASGSPETAYAFARMSLAVFQREGATPEFAETLRIAARG